MEYPFGPSFAADVLDEQIQSLNPSFSGISFRTARASYRKVLTSFVLILLLVEYPFGPINDGFSINNLNVLILLLVEYPFGQCAKLAIDAGGKVLILLLVEYPFGPNGLFTVKFIYTGLNPSFSGISFRTFWLFDVLNFTFGVLILLLVEYPFGQRKSYFICPLFLSLNPSFSGISFRTTSNGQRQL